MVAPIEFKHRVHLSDVSPPLVRRPRLPGYLPVVAAYWVGCGVLVHGVSTGSMDPERWLDAAQQVSVARAASPQPTPAPHRDRAPSRPTPLRSRFDRVDVPPETVGASAFMPRDLEPAPEPEAELPLPASGPVTSVAGDLGGGARSLRADAPTPPSEPRADLPAGPTVASRSASPVPPASDLEGFEYPEPFDLPEASPARLGASKGARGAPAPAAEPAPAPARRARAPRAMRYPSCEAAMDAARQDVDLTAPGRGAPDLSRADFARVLDSGAYLLGCGVPERMSIDVCAAIQQGRVVGVTITTRPGSTAIQRCVAAQVSHLAFPAHAKLDVARTHFDAVR